MWKIDPKLQKVAFPCFSEHCHGNMCNLNVIVVLEFISRDLYLLFVILLSSKFQNSTFYQHMRPKCLKFPRPLFDLTFYVPVNSYDHDMIFLPFYGTSNQHA